MAKDITKFAHPAYLAALPDYVKIRDCFNGERAMKDAGARYLPMLSGQTMFDYDNYRRRALFFPIVGKTSSSMVGMATTKEPKVSYPPVMAPFFKDTEAGAQFTETYVGIFQEVVLMGRYGMLIDGKEGGAPLPTLNGYIAENIVNWAYDEQGERLVMLLLRENISVRHGPFETVQTTQYRHCYLDNGVYTVEVLNDDLEAKSPPTIPMFSGHPIDEIPFVPFGSSGVHMDVDKQPMLDIATINISHYMTSADLEWGRHIVGLPTPVISGVDASTSLKIGGTAAWILPGEQAKAFYLEFQGQGLQSLEKAMVEKISLMSTMSARLVDNSTRGSEAAETVRLRYMSEAASLIHIIGAVENGCMIMYNTVGRLMQAAGDVSIKFSREILSVGVAFKDLAVLFEAYLNASISKETLLYNLRRLDAVDPNRTDEEELAAIRDPLPPAPVTVSVPGAPSPVPPKPPLPH